MAVGGGNRQHIKKATSVAFFVSYMSGLDRIGDADASSMRYR
jgi:hypothetical protein